MPAIAELLLRAAQPLEIRLSVRLCVNPGGPNRNRYILYRDSGSRPGQPPDVPHEKLTHP